MQSVWTALSGMQTSQQWMKNISNNVANSSTTGYADVQTSFVDEYTRALQGSATASPAVSGRFTPPGWRGGSGAFVSASESNFNGMSLNQTGNPTDIAIQGNGFFMVQGQNGQPLLTKDGNFQWAHSANGAFVLSTALGQAVLDVNGKPIVKQGTGDFSVSPDGQISVGGTTTQKLAMVEVSLPSQNLTPVGDGLYQANAAASPVVANGNGNGNSSDSTLVQGALNSSNVDLTKEMTNMIEAQDMYEVNAQAESVNNKMMETSNAIGQGAGA